MKQWDLKRVCKVLWEGKILIIVFAILGAVIGYNYNTKYTKPVYQSSSSIILSVTDNSTKAKKKKVQTSITNEIEEDTISQSDVSLSSKMMNTYAKIIKSKSVVNRVIKDLKLNITYNDLVKNITVVPEDNTTLIRIQVKSEDPEEAAKIVKALDKVFLKRIKQLYNIKDAKILDEAEIEDVPTNIFPKKYTLISAMIGLAIAIFILILREYFDDRLKTESDVKQRTKLDVLALIGKFKDKTKLISLEEKNVQNEAFRTLLANIRYANKKSVLVVSNEPGEGKSIVSANLALICASSGKKTLLIDSDMRKGTQDELFHLNNSIGLSNIILVGDNSKDYDAYINKDVVNNLDVLTKGPGTLNYSRLLFHDEVIKNLIEYAESKYDFIIFDGTPVKLVADNTALYKCIDSTIIVVKYNNTKAQDVNSIRDTIRNNNGNLLGVVINNIPPKASSNKKYYKYDGYYGYSSKKKDSKTNKIIKTLIKIFLVVMIIVGILLGSLFIYLNHELSKIKTELIDTGKIGISDRVREELADYRSIAILGIDSREDDYSLGNRSDCIIVACINEKTHDIKLFSVYRDTYLLLEEKGKEKLDKVTHAYSFGGAQNALKALNTNLDLNISEYVTVNFDAAISAVDALGGVYVNIEKNELKYLNGYIDSTSNSSGVSSSHINKEGYQKLDGVQAVAYSRIRYTAGGDYKRAERMRTVLEAILNKAQKQNIKTLNKVANEILPKVKTNISKKEIISLIPKIGTYDVDESLGWPYNVRGITLDRWYGVPVTLEKNVQNLHEEVFGQEDYEVSDTVKSISEKIVKKTKYDE